MCLEGIWEFLVAAFQSLSFFAMLPLQNHFDFSITDWASMDCLQLHEPIKPHLTLQGHQHGVSFMNGLKTVNNMKSQHDHETGNTHKHFWICATLAYNNHHNDDVVHNVNAVNHDTIDTVAAVTTEFNPEEMEDESVNC